MRGRAGRALDGMSVMLRPHCVPACDTVPYYRHPRAGEMELFVEHLLHMPEQGNVTRGKAGTTTCANVWWNQNIPRTCGVTWWGMARTVTAQAM